jgi:IS66 Orf2 like protein
MFGLGPATKVYLALGATDMRKGFDGLYGLVRERLLCEPTSGHLFLFSNAREVLLSHEELVLSKDPTVPPHVRKALDVIARNVEIEARLIDDLLISRAPARES